MDKIHFKLTHGGVTRRIALPRDEDDLLSALKTRVLKITGTDDVNLFWRDEDSIVVLACQDDMHAAIDYAETQNKLGCITLETEENQVEVKEETKEADVKTVVTADESQAAFNGFAFTCDECNCFLAPSNGGRFKCTLCDNYDLCVECLLKNKHDNHPFVRLLNAETEIQILNECCRALTKDTPRCTPLFVVKSRNGQSNAEKIMNQVEDWNVQKDGSGKKLMDIHDLTKQVERERKEAEKLKKRDKLNSESDKKKIEEEEEEKKKEYTRSEMMAIRNIPTYYTESDSDYDPEDDEECNYSDEEEIINAVDKAFLRAAKDAFADAVKSTERPPSYTASADNLIQLEDQPPLPTPQPEQISAVTTSPAVQQSQQLQPPHSHPVAYTRPKYPPPGVSQHRPPMSALATEWHRRPDSFRLDRQNLNDDRRRGGGFGERQPERRGRGGFEPRLLDDDHTQREERNRGFGDPNAGYPRADGFGLRREDEQRGFGPRSAFGSVRSHDRRDDYHQRREPREQWDLMRRGDRRETQMEDRRGFGQSYDEYRRFAAEGERRSAFVDREESEERRAFRERRDRENRRREGMTERRGFGERSDDEEDEAGRRRQRQSVRNSSDYGVENTVVPSNPRAVHDFHRQAAAKLRLEKEKQRKKEKEDDYVKASQIPAHMAIGVLIEDTKKMKKIMELETKLSEYIKNLQCNTYSLKPHARIFANGDDVKLIGNIAVDLEKHLRNIRQAVRDWRAANNGTRFGDEDNQEDWDWVNSSECWAKMKDRVRQLKDALYQNEASGEEYRLVAEKLRPILLTRKYTSFNGEPHGNWDDVFVGFMEADPLRDNVAPPRVASANPDREGVFAPTPRGCRASAAAAAAADEEKAEKKETDEELLRELEATNLFDDYDKMFEVCSKAADLREAIDMMLQ